MKNNKTLIFLLVTVVIFLGTIWLFSGAPDPSQVEPAAITESEVLQATTIAPSEEAPDPSQVEPAAITESEVLIYKSVDKEGNVTYSDEPVKEEKPLILPILNVIPPPPPRAAEIPLTKTSLGYKIFNVAVPANETTVPRGQKEITVEIAISPLLRPGHFIALDLNGNRIGEPRKGTRLHLELINPGTQKLVASIVNKSGTVVQTTPPIVIHNVAPGPLTTTILRESALSEGNLQKANRYAPKVPQAPRAPQAPRLGEAPPSPPTPPQAP